LAFSEANELCRAARAASVDLAMLGVAAGAVLLLGGGFFLDATKPLGANMARNWGCGFSAETRFI